jgi:hypothetical protein
LCGGLTDQGEVSQNVEVKKITVDRLPTVVIEEIQAKLLEYTTDTQQLGNIVAYSWDSAWFHEQGKPPNYVIDFSHVKIPKDSSPTAEPLCNSEGCLLEGYTFVANAIWKQDFELRSQSTSFVRIDDSDGQNYQVEIHTLSNAGDCVKSQDIGTDNGCLRRFSWHKFGLSSLSPSH